MLAVPSHWPALLGRAAVVLVLADTTEASGAAPPPQTTVRSIQATAGDMLKLADELERRGDRDQAGKLLDLLEQDPESDVRNEARFRKSRMLEEEGRPEAAAVLLRQILDDKPEAGAVRLKLAGLMQQMGDEQAALRELRALRSSDLPLTVARFVDRLSASLQASKPLGFQFELALAPDSNVNRATRLDTVGTVLGDFELDESAKARSGTGIASRWIGQLRIPVSDALRLQARAGIEANVYRHSEFNDIAVDVAAGPEFRLGRTRFSLEAGAVQRWYGMHPYQRSYTLLGSAVRAMDPVSQLRAEVGVRWAGYEINKLQDGRGLLGHLRYERSLSPLLLVSASLGVDRFKADDPAYSTTSWAAGVAAYREVGRVTLSAGIDVARLKADDRLLLLPKARNDRTTRIQIGAVYRQLTVAGFAPMTRLVIERNRSTIEYYDYRRVRTEFGISRAF